MRDALSGTALAGAPMIPVSTVSGSGVALLRDEIAAAARNLQRRQTSGRFRLAVDRSFTIQGAGTVVTGTVLSGQVSVEDRLTISPSGLEARVRSIHAQNRPSEIGRAGDRCALNLVGPDITKTAIGRGDVVCDHSLHAPTSRIDATLRVLGSEPKAIGHWFPVRLHHASAEVGARIVLLADEPVAPGTRTLVQLVLERPIAAAAGDRYVVRDTSARRTIGGGRFLDLRAPHASVAQRNGPRNSPRCHRASRSRRSRHCLPIRPISSTSALLPATGQWPRAKPRQWQSP